MRKLTIRKERLAELTTAELAAVDGGHEVKVTTTIVDATIQVRTLRRCLTGNYTTPIDTC